MQLRNRPGPIGVLHPAQILDVYNLMRYGLEYNRLKQCNDQILPALQNFELSGTEYASATVSIVSPSIALV